LFGGALRNPEVSGPVGLYVIIFYSISFHKRISTTIPHPKKARSKRKEKREKFVSSCAAWNFYIHNRLKLKVYVYLKVALLICSNLFNIFGKENTARSETNLRLSHLIWVYTRSCFGYMQVSLQFTRKSKKKENIMGMYYLIMGTIVLIGISIIVGICGGIIYLIYLPIKSKLL
jgi:ABC-type phosphate transport system permease subunit